MTPQLSDTPTENVPEYLKQVLDEAEDAVAMNDDPNNSQIADEVATEQRHLITDRGERDNLAVLQDLRDLDALSVGNLEMHQKGAISYNRPDATIEAIVVSSLETFIYEHLEQLAEQDAGLAEE
jgi:hypothetical protein